jgi:hypothetical protein
VRTNELALAVSFFMGQGLTLEEGQAGTKEELQKRKTQTLCAVHWEAISPPPFCF